MVAGVPSITLRPSHAQGSRGTPGKAETSGPTSADLYSLLFGLNWVSNYSLAKSTGLQSYPSGVPAAQLLSLSPEAHGSLGTGEGLNQIRSP